MPRGLSSTSLAPGLLLAMPQLMDPNFNRSVVLMVEHNEGGSFGLVVNQPSGIRALELLDGLGMPWRGDPDAVVWSGGPVSPSTGWVLHEPLDALPAVGKLGDGATIEVTSRLSLTTSPDALRLIAAAPPPNVRLLLGYSGWAPGQLAAEMSRGSWLHADVDASILFDGPPDQMWDRSVRSLGIANPEALVQGRGVH
jgi:putative transcriptional regulator